MDNYLIITIDYETWHPACEEDILVMQKLGLKIDWEKDIINPAYQLLDVADAVGAKLTFMVEMGEYLWLKENKHQDIVNKINKQLQSVIERGHDVQLHLHPHWLPETGASVDEMGIWVGNVDYASADQYPYDLSDALQRVKTELQSIIRRVKPDYEVTCFRAGGYRIQPFSRLYDALLANSIYCDTSIYYKGRAKDRGYNFTKCKHQILPYYAKKTDPVWEDNDGILEIPIYSDKRGNRWMMDAEMGNELAVWFYRCCDIEKSNQNYYVMVGHTKESHNLKKVEEQLKFLTLGQSNQWITLSEAVRKFRENENKEKNICLSLDNLEMIYGEKKRGEVLKILHGSGSGDGIYEQDFWIDFCFLDLRKSGYEVKIIDFLQDKSRMILVLGDGKKGVFEPAKGRLIPFQKPEELSQILSRDFGKRGYYTLRDETKVIRLKARGIKQKLWVGFWNCYKNLSAVFRIKKL